MKKGNVSKTPQPCQSKNSQSHPIVLQDSKEIPQTEADYNWTSSIKIDILDDSVAYTKTAKIYVPVDKILSLNSVW